LPAEFRPKAKITALNAFTREDLDAIQRQHSA
jgi:hypothetical protein